MEIVKNKLNNRDIIGGKMKKYIMILTLFVSFLHAQSFDGYLESFNYKERKDMKIKTYEMLNLIEEDKAVLIDIRFPEEFKVWSVGFSKNIPLNELSKRLDELPKDKLIITACPHNDRANLARIFLKLKGYNARYLSDGLLKTVDYLRGDNAKEFLEEINKGK